MHVHQQARREGGWDAISGTYRDGAHLVMVFSSSAQLRSSEIWGELRARYPRARIVGCSTAGEIVDTTVWDDSLVCTAVEFERASVAVATARVDEAQSATELGSLLMSRLPQQGLVHVFVLSDGLLVNGSALVAGIVSKLAPGVAVTGGLAGDGARFETTAVCLDGPEPSRQVVAVGFYGDELKVGYGSFGGWDPFGPERRITKSAGNVLFELDHEPALALYKRYLAEHAAQLPASGLLFPLTIRPNDEAGTPVVRTILGVDEAAQSLTFAGDVPLGFRARLMRANFERLVDGAGTAARATQSLQGAEPQLAFLISCVGRKLVLKQRVEEEVEAVRDILGPGAALTGFYSYGEISPFTAAAPCELHNQTMTITTLSER